MINSSSVSFVSIREASKITGINPQTLRILADQNKVKSYKTLSGQRKFDKLFLEKMCNSSSSIMDFNDKHSIRVDENIDVHEPSHEHEDEHEPSHEHESAHDHETIHEHESAHESAHEHEDTFLKNKDDSLLINDLYPDLIKSTIEFNNIISESKKMKRIKNDINKINIIYARITSNMSYDNLNLQINYIKSYDNKKYANYKTIIDVEYQTSNNISGMLSIVDLSIKKLIDTVVIAHKDIIDCIDYEFFKYIINICGGSLIILNNTKFKISDKTKLMNLISTTYDQFSLCK